MCVDVGVFSPSLSLFVSYYFPNVSTLNLEHVQVLNDESLLALTNSQYRVPLERLNLYSNLRLSTHSVLTTCRMHKTLKVVHIFDCPYVEMSQLKKTKKRRKKKQCLFCFVGVWGPGGTESLGVGIFKSY